MKKKAQLSFIAKLILALVGVGLLVGISVGWGGDIIAIIKDAAGRLVP
ncbi:hypothetical protein GOV10_05250 [Candidatus Woesearchaeota archaeon]|nr:hypothetical protein [Candidatus Woesearchaeota archaeon]